MSHRPLGNQCHQVMVWLGQTHSSPSYDGRAIVAGFKALCTMEIKEIIDVMKPLQEKYQPQIH